MAKTKGQPQMLVKLQRKGQNVLHFGKWFSIEAKHAVTTQTNNLYFWVCIPN